MTLRNKKGQFFQGTKGETAEEKTKRVNSLIEAQKRSPKYLGELKFSPIYNVWRSFMFTKKGNKIGHSKEWGNFKKFYEDMHSTYKKGLRLGRIDKSKEFSKKNSLWMTDSELAFSRGDALKFTHNGKTKLLKEWCLIYKIPYNGVKQRLHSKKYNSFQEILFGRRMNPKKEIRDILTLSQQKGVDKISKMISSYKSSDKKRGREFNLDNKWFKENIISKPCTYCKSLLNIGCDRIDNKKGHTKDNVLPACYNCNVCRQDIFSVEEMKILGKTINKIIKGRLLTNK